MWGRCLSGRHAIEVHRLRRGVEVARWRLRRTADRQIKLADVAKNGDGPELTTRWSGRRGREGDRDLQRGPLRQVDAVGGNRCGDAINNGNRGKGRRRIDNLGDRDGRRRHAHRGERRRQ